MGAYLQGQKLDLIQNGGSNNYVIIEERTMNPVKLTTQTLARATTDDGGAALESEGPYVICLKKNALFLTNNLNVRDSVQSLPNNVDLNELRLEHVLFLWYLYNHVTVGGGAHTWVRTLDEIKSGVDFKLTQDDVYIYLTITVTDWSVVYYPLQNHEEYTKGVRAFQFVLRYGDSYVLMTSNAAVFGEMSGTFTNNGDGDARMVPETMDYICPVVDTEEVVNKTVYVNQGATPLEIEYLSETSLPKIYLRTIFRASFASTVGDPVTGSVLGSTAPYLGAQNIVFTDYTTTDRRIENA